MTTNPSKPGHPTQAQPGIPSGSSHIRDVVKEVPDLKARFACELQVHGSCSLAQTLIENDLIDEYRLLTFPVILGSGKRLLGAGAVPASLKRVRSHTAGTGVVVSDYRRAGSLKTGSVELPAAISVQLPPAAS